jgi:hypothetical protein
VVSFNSKLSFEIVVVTTDCFSDGASLQDSIKRLVRPAAAKVVWVRNSFLFIAEVRVFDEINIANIV